MHSIVSNYLSSYLQSAGHEKSWNILDTIASAAIIGGGVACASIGRLRLVPLAAIAAGTGMLALNFKQHCEGRSWSVAVHSKKFWTNAFLIAALAAPIFYFTRIKGCVPADVLPLQLAHPTGSMASDILDFASIAHLQKIYGISIEEHPYISYFPVSAGMNLTESFRQLLRKDWKTVDALGTTHIELAGHLRALWDSLPRCNNYWFGQRKPSILDGFHLFFYDPNKLENNTVGNGSGMQLLNGCFGCNLGASTAGFNDHFNPSCVADVMNPINGVGMKIRFNYLNDGSIDSIKKYGYYGNPDSPFSSSRIDPVRLVALLTGQDPCSIQKSINQPCV